MREASGNGRNSMPDLTSTDSKSMKLTPVALFSVFASTTLFAQESHSTKDFAGSPVVAEGASLVLASEAFKFTEGPACTTNGDVYFTDQPNDRIHRWVADTGKIELFLEPAGRANGLFVDPSDGTLLACADEENELWRIDLKTKKHEVLLATFEGKRFNGPNDVWVLPNGDLYFTDPFYKRPYWKRGDRELSQQVYFLPKGSNAAKRVTDDLVQPNGIVGKGDHLYVADIGDKKTYRYRIGDDGRLSDRTLWTDMGSDGMTIDEAGNLYLTGKGITVVSPEREKIEHIPVPEGWTANVSFGGKDRRTLVITAMDSVYTLAMKARGVLSSD